MDCTAQSASEGRILSAKGQVGQTASARNCPFGMRGYASCRFVAGLESNRGAAYCTQQFECQKMQGRERLRSCSAAFVLPSSERGLS